MSNNVPTHIATGFGPQSAPEASTKDREGGIMLVAGLSILLQGCTELTEAMLDHAIQAAREYDLAHSSDADGTMDIDSGTVDAAAGANAGASPQATPETSGVTSNLCGESGEGGITSDYSSEGDCKMSYAKFMREISSMALVAAYADKQYVSAMAAHVVEAEIGFCELGGEGGWNQGGAGQDDALRLLLARAQIADTVLPPTWAAGDGEGLYRATMETFQETLGTPIMGILPDPQARDSDCHCTMCTRARELWAAHSVDGADGEGDGIMMGLLRKAFTEVSDLAMDASVEWEDLEYSGSSDNDASWGPPSRAEMQ